MSDAEFGVLAGAERVEGTLFGIGERTKRRLDYFGDEYVLTRL
ncbi:hypothetical protein ACEQPO_04330 [Bacillus sp. SL00103]